MRHYTVMQGVTGEYRTEYATREEAEAKAESIRNLGWECVVETVEE